MSSNTVTESFLFEKEWKRAKNVGLNLSDLSYGSNKKVWWICSQGHEWEASINSRVHNHGCPYCAGKKAIVGINDLATTHPQTAKEWHPTKNMPLSPAEVMSKSSKKVWWLCNRGHEWEAKIYNRTRGDGCPYCSGKRVLSGVNDFATVNPQLVSEWHPEKNLGIDLSEVAAYSNKKYWWICRYGHEWLATPNHRSNGNNCPKCSEGIHTSFPEQALYYYIHKTFPDAISSDLHLGVELDIYIPSREIGIEYDGVQWHSPYKRQRNDIIKNNIIAASNDSLLRIREKGCPVLPDCENVSVINVNSGISGKKYLAALSKVISDVFDFLNCACAVDVEKDYDDILQQYAICRNNGSLLSTNPGLADEWNYERNGKLIPESVLAGSGKYVWWKCSKGHEWKAQIKSRRDGVGCPYCSGRVPVPGENDLKTTHSELAAQWHPTRNNEITPEQVASQSDKKVWWLCSEGHEWQAVISSRVRGTGCPYCSGRYAIPGTNDLATENPALASQWHPTKNGALTPHQVKPRSDKKVWWLGECGHEWESTISNRTAGNGCPICKRRK